MKRWLCAVLVALAITVSLPAVADGGKRDVSGTRWVDPVEYLELKQAFSKLETSTKIVDGFEKKGTLALLELAYVQLVLAPLTIRCLVQGTRLDAPDVAHDEPDVGLSAFLRHLHLYHHALIICPGACLAG